MSDQTTFLDDLKPVSASELMGGGGVISAVRTIDDPDQCVATGCAMQADLLETCRDHRCPHRGHRTGCATRTVAPAGGHQMVEGGTPC
jgi:hypothetical protein